MTRNANEMVFGSEDWMKELKNRVDFPQMFVIFYGLHKETNEPTLQSVKIKTSSRDPKNIKYGTVKPTLGMGLSPYKWTVEGVYFIESADEYLQKMTALGKRWNVDFNK